MNTTITSITQMQDGLRLLAEPKDYANLDDVKYLTDRAEQLREAIVIFRESAAEIDKDQVNEGIERVLNFILRLYDQVQSVTDLDIATKEAVLKKAQEGAEKAPAEQRLEASQIADRAKQALEGAKARSATVKSLSEAPRQKFRQFKEEQKHDYVNYILLPIIHDAGNLINSGKLKVSLEQIVKNYGRKLAKDPSAASLIGKLNAEEVNIFANPAIAAGNDSLQAFMGSIKNNLEGECSDESHREFVKLLGILGFHLAKAIVTRSEKFGRFILAYKAVDAVIAAGGFNENALASFAPKTADTNNIRMIDGTSIVVLDAARSVSDLIIFLVNNGSPDAQAIANIMQVKSKKPYSRATFEDNGGYGTIHGESFECLTPRTDSRSVIMRAREAWRLSTVISGAFFILSSFRHIRAYEEFKKFITCQANLQEYPSPAPLKPISQAAALHPDAPRVSLGADPLRSSQVEIGASSLRGSDVQKENAHLSYFNRLLTPQNRFELYVLILVTLAIAISFLFFGGYILYAAVISMRVFYELFFVLGVVGLVMLAASFKNIS